MIWFIATYNRFVGLRNMIAESWSDIDTELKRRYDLIPNLVATVKGYAAHEKAVFEEVTKAQGPGRGFHGFATFAGPGRESTGSFLAAIVGWWRKSYPQLKADRNFLELQKELVNTEDRIQAARRFFNGNVREFNVLVETVPSNLMAKMAGFKRQDFFETRRPGRTPGGSGGFQGIRRRLTCGNVNCGTR